MTEPLLIEHQDGVDRVTLNSNQVLCNRSEDFGEGIRAFLEKRKPVYIKR